MDISEANLEEHCYLNTVKERRLYFLYLVKKEQKPLESFKKDVAFHQTKTLFTDVTPLKTWTSVDKILT